MNKIDWRRKLTSRKLWLSLISFVSAVLIFFHVDLHVIESLGTILWALGSLVAYIIGEGLVDAKNISINVEKPLDKSENDVV